MDEIRNLIARFANSFDLQDWEGLRAVLCDSLEVDYTDLRGAKETVSSRQYAEQRIESLTPLKTQHLFTNLEIALDGDGARCRASAQIQRVLEGRHFDTHAVYDFVLIRETDGWRISSIRQRVLWNEGDPSIHTGTHGSRR